MFTHEKFNFNMVNFLHITQQLFLKSMSIICHCLVVEYRVRYDCIMMILDCSISWLTIHCYHQHFFASKVFPIVVKYVQKYHDIYKRLALSPSPQRIFPHFLFWLKVNPSNSHYEMLANNIRPCQSHMILWVPSPFSGAPIPKLGRQNTAYFTVHQAVEALKYSRVLV